MLEALCVLTPAGGLAQESNPVDGQAVAVAATLPDVIAPPGLESGPVFGPVFGPVSRDALTLTSVAAPEALTYAGLWQQTGQGQTGQGTPVTEKPMKPQVESEIIVEGMVSYGNYQIFAAGTDSKLYDAGVEYDRHTWGKFLGARFDYVAEFTPFVLLNQPAVTDKWGNPMSKDRKYVPGVGIAPIGFRWMWRAKKQWRPYLEAKGGIIGFTQKALSNDATYENFSLQSCMGVQVMMTQRVGLRLGLFSDFHFSNAFITDYNPGLDVMNANLGISWHFHDP